MKEKKNTVKFKTKATKTRRPNEASQAKTTMLEPAQQEPRLATFGARIKRDECRHRQVTEAATCRPTSDIGGGDSWPPSVTMPLASRRRRRRCQVASRWALIGPALLLLALGVTGNSAALAAPQQTIGALQQSMAQLLQVFNGNESVPHLAGNHFKLLERHGEHLLVGARNVVYNLSLSTMREQRRLEWPSSEDDVSICRMKGKSMEQCHNYIRVLKLQSPDMLFVCGTNAYRPRCRSYQVTTNAYELVSESSGEGISPYQENQNVTSLFADGELYSATRAQFSGHDSLIHRAPLRTEQFNPKQLNSPNFVSSFRYGEHVYFMFREQAIEHINCGKTIYSRIARVCVNDSGASSRANRDRWTSFVKARLNCSIPGEYPFYFDEIQSSTHIVSSSSSGSVPMFDGLESAPQMAPHTSGIPDQPNPLDPATDLLYAVFTTPTNSIGGSAVCAFRMADVLAAFEGPFKSQADSNANWLPVPESRVPQPRPGTCVNDSRRLPDEHVNFIKDNPLMDTAIEPVWSQPLVLMASINFRFTQIAVDAQVETQQAPGAHHMRTDVVFVATDDGRVFKLINTHHLYAAAAATAAGASSQGVTSSSGEPLPPVSLRSHLAPPTQVSPLAQQPHYSAWQRPPNPADLQAGFRSPVASPQVMQFGTGSASAMSEPLPDVSSSTVVIEELHLFDSRTPILNMLIYYPAGLSSASMNGGAGSGAYHHQYPKLIVLAAHQLKAVPLSRCERALTCFDCQALYDPYCAWDLRLQACLAVGRSALFAPGAQSSSRFATAGGLRHSSQNNWFPPNNPATSSIPANNFTLAWWSRCPADLAGQQQQQQPQVAAPYRSLFSSHLQVPSRFDYASGHHLSHTALFSLAQPSTQSNSIASTGLIYKQQPVSECLTFCGGLYAPPTLPGGGAAHQHSSGAESASSSLMMHCADYVQQHYIGPPSNGILQLLPNGTLAAQQTANLYTSENLYIAVIICAVAGLIFGTVFGFAIGRNARKHDSSICSSTFDETNLYMASTGSHQGAANLFAQQQRLHHQLHHPLLQQAAGNGLLTANGGLNRQGGGNMYETASQCLLSDANQSTGQLYGNQQQMLLHLTGLNGTSTATTNNHLQHQNSGSSMMRIGALPPLPATGPGSQQNGPLVSTSTSSTHINQSQLTPNSVSSNGNHQTGMLSSGGSSTNTSSTSATVPASDQHHQLQLYQQQLINGTNNNSNSNNNHLHQRSFTNGSSNGSSLNKGSNRLDSLPVGKLSGKAATTFGHLQPQQQQLQQQQQNKIYL